MKIIKNEVVLTPEYFPDKPIGRDNEIQLIDKLLFSSDAQSTVVVKGKPGSGKTLIAKYIIKQHQEYNGSYVNCYTSNSDRLILSDIAKKDIWRGGDFLSSSIENIARQIFKDNTRKNLIILDEVHSLKSSNSRIIYLLGRSTELNLPPVKLLLLTIEDPEMFLDGHTLSTLNKLNQINLFDYGTEQLFAILKNRAQLGLYDGTYDDETLHKIAEISNPSGNARMAIELLRYSSKLAELRDVSLSPDLILDVSKEFSEPIDNSALEYLDDWEIEILIVFLNNLNRNSFISDDLKKYAPDIPESRIYKLLRDMENAGLINKEKKGLGYGGGVKNTFSFIVQRGMLLKALMKIKY